MKGFILAAGVVTLTVCSVHADGVDDFVRAAITRRHIPGVAIAVVKNGTVVRIAGYGLADREQNVVPGLHTVFRIGSLSKQFIASGIMVLVQDRTIALSDPVTTFIPEVPQTWRDITIRHLLTHTAGLPREAPAADLTRAKADIELIRSAYRVQLQWKPGDKYAYSNLGYYILAEVMTRVSGTPWSDPPGGHVTGVPMIRHEGTIPGFRPGFTRLPKQGLTIIVLTNLDRGAVDAIIAGIAIRYAPELIPHALRQWTDKEALGLQ